MSAKTIKRMPAALVCVAVLGATALPAVAHGATARTAGKGACVYPPKVTKFLSRITSFGPDFSFARLTWSPEFCPNGKNGWKVSGKPELTELGAGSTLGIGINFDAPTHHSIGITYYGQVRNCAPIGAGYAGISYTGKLCVTDAKGLVGAYVNGQGKVFYRFPQLKPEGIDNLDGRSRWVWTNGVI